MSHSELFPVPANFAAQAHIDKTQYDAMYQRSIDQPELFWAEQAQSFLTWQQPWDEVRSFDFHKGEASWFKGAKLNVSENCIDRHLATRSQQVAIIWEGVGPA